MENRKKRLPNRVFFYFTVLIIYIFFYKLYVTILNLPYDFKTSKREKYSFPPGSVNIPNILSHIFQPLQDSYIFRTILIAERFTNDSTWALPIKFNTTTTSIEERNITLESWSFPAKVFFRDKFLISEPMVFSTLIEPNNYLTEFNFSFMTNTKYFTHITVYHQFNQTNFDPVIKFKENVKHISLFSFLLILVQYTFSRKSYTSLLCLILASVTFFASCPFVQNEEIAFLGYCAFNSCFRCIIPLICITKLNYIHNSHWSFTIPMSFLALIYFVSIYTSIYLPYNPLYTLEPILLPDPSYYGTIIMTLFFSINVIIVFLFTICTNQGKLAFQFLVSFFLYIFSCIVSFTTTFSIFWHSTFFSLNEYQSLLFDYCISLMTSLFISLVLLIPRNLSHHHEKRNRFTSIQT